MKLSELDDMSFIALGGRNACIAYDVLIRSHMRPEYIPYRIGN